MDRIPLTAGGHENSVAVDVMQESFFTVSRKAATFEPGTYFVAWTCGIARLKALENLRQRKRATTLSEAAIIALAEEAPAPETQTARESVLARCLERGTPKVCDLLSLKGRRKSRITRISRISRISRIIKELCL